MYNYNLFFKINFQSLTNKIILAINESLSQNIFLPGKAYFPDHFCIFASSMENLKIINNTERSRFEMAIDGEFAILEYRFFKNNIALIHTAVPENMKGKGIGSKLVLAAIDFAVQQNKKIMLYCSFAAKFVKAHPEFYKYIDEAFQSSLKD
jgi:predicted GNAT family acetyltransferase